MNRSTRTDVFPEPAPAETVTIGPRARMAASCSLGEAGCHSERAAEGGEGEESPSSRPRGPSAGMTAIPRCRSE